MSQSEQPMKSQKFNVNFLFELKPKISAIIKKDEVHICIFKIMYNTYIHICINIYIYK